MNLLSVDEISINEIPDYIRQNRPAVLRNAAKTWSSRWTPESLRERLGGQTLQAETRDPNPKERRQLTLPLASFFDLVSQRSSPYRVRSVDFFSHLPELAAEVSSENPFRALYPGARERHYALWISPPGNTSSLHHDANAQNLNLQIFGRKTFQLYAPSSYSQLSPYAATQSPINPFSEDAQRYPKFQRLSGLTATLSPGDVLLLPKYWWHCVYTEETSINLNLWFDTELSQSPWRVLEEVPLLPRLALTFAAHSNQKLSREAIRLGRHLYQFATRKNKPHA